VSGTAFSCSSSSDCSSGTCHESVCAYDIEYADESGFSAQLYTDSVALDSSGTLSTPATIGGIYKKRKGEFEPTAVDGIVGFAYQTLASSGEPTPFEAWVSAGKLANIFSMCLTDTGGSIVLGGGTATAIATAVSYTPLLEETYYVVDMLDLEINGVGLGLNKSVYNRGGAIVDSGTTDLILPKTAYDALVSKLKANCTSASLPGLCGEESGKTIFDGYCFELTSADITEWPVLQVALDGVTLAIPPSAYIRTSGCDSGQYSSSVEYGSDGDGTILGDVFMKAYTVIFDRENKRVGFTPSTCADSPATAPKVADLVEDA